MVSRIKQLLDWQQLSPTQFADRIGIGRPVVSHILSERNKPSLDVVQRIIAAFPELSLPWLLSGSGDMLTNTSPPAAPMSMPPATAPAQLLPTDPAISTPAVPATPASTLLMDAVAPIAAPAALVTATAAPSVPTAAETKRPAVASAPAFRVAPAGQPVVSPRPTVMPPPRFRPASAANSGPGTPAAPVAVGSAAPAAELVGATIVAGAGATTDVSTPTIVELASEAVPVATPVAGKAAEQKLLSEPAWLVSDQPMGVVAALASPLLAGLGEPGKAIRRIVIFYRDGSFADYQPES